MGVKDSFVKRLSLGPNLWVVRMLIVTLLMVVVSAAGLVRGPVRAAAGRAAIQEDGLTAEGVMLDFDEGTHKKGEVIPLARITRPTGGGGVDVSAGEASGCPSRHLHGTIEILQCTTVKDGMLETRVQGPFFDPFASDRTVQCGHGKVMPYRADVSVAVSVQPPLQVQNMYLVTYMVTLTNNGPDTADLLRVSCRFEPAETVIEEVIEGADFFDFRQPVILALPPNDVRFLLYRDKIPADFIGERTTLVSTFFAIARAGCNFRADIDPNPGNNSAALTTRFVGVGTISFTIEGKNLRVIGDFGVEVLAGAVVLVDGKEKNTRVDADNPRTTLIARKGAKKIGSGQMFTLQIRFADGKLTPEVTFTAP